MCIAPFRKCSLHRNISKSFATSLWSGSFSGNESDLRYLDNEPRTEKEKGPYSRKNDQERETLSSQSSRSVYASPSEAREAPNPKSPFAYIDFRRLENPNAIFSALRSSQDFLQMRQIVAALTRLRTLGLCVPRSLLKSVLDLAAGTLGSCRSQDVVGFFYSMAQLRLLTHPRLLNALAKIAIERKFVKDMSIRELATMIHACGFLVRYASKCGVSVLREAESGLRMSGYEPHEEGSCGLTAVEELMDVAIEELCVFRELDEEYELRLPSILTSLGHFGAKDWRIDRLIQQLAISISKVRHFSEDRISAIIYSVANCRIQHRGILEKLAMEMTKPERLIVFQTQQLMNLMVALHRLRFMSYGLWYAIFVELTQKIRLMEMKTQDFEKVLRFMVYTQMNEDGELASRIFKEMTAASTVESIRPVDAKSFLILASKFPKFESLNGTLLISKVLEDSLLSQISNSDFIPMIHGCSKFLIEDSKLIAFLIKETRRDFRLHELSSSQLVSVLYSIDHMQASPHSDLLPVIHQCLLHDQISQINTHSTCQLIEIVSRHQIQASKQISTLLYKMTKSKQPLSMQQLATLLSHLSLIPNMSRQPIRSLIRAVFPKSWPIPLPPLDMSVLVCALGKLRIYHATIMEQTQKYVAHKHEAFSPEDVKNCLLGFAHLQFRDSESIGFLLVQGRYVLGLETFPSTDLAFILHCLAKLEILTEHYEAYIREATSWIRLSSLRVYDLALLVIAVCQIDQMVTITDRDCILHMCEFLGSHSELGSLSKNHLKELRSCAIYWRLDKKLKIKFHALADQHDCNQASDSHISNEHQLLLMDCKDKTRAWKKHLLDGR